MSNNIVKSKNEVRRLAAQGGIKINNNTVYSIINVTIDEEMIIQVGKRKFIKIKFK